MKLPEGDFPEAKNYFDFVSNFMGKETKFPFARQLWLATMLLGEFCPRCSDKKFLTVTNVPVNYKPREMPDRIQFLNYGVCPKCNATKSEMIASKEMNAYVEMALCVGQRGGKTALTSSIIGYLIHKYLKFPKLSSICEGIQSSNILTGTFVAGRATDAIDLLWKPVINIVEDSKWFSEYHEMLTDAGERYSTEFYRKKDLYLRYAHRNLEFYPSGPTKRGLRGRTRIITATDEIGWFPSPEDNKDRERADAPEVYDALDRSLLTVRQETKTLLRKGYNNFFPGLAINISSPSAQGDMIMRLVDTNLTSKRVLALRMPTWEINPLYTRDTEEIASAYKANPSNAERDYGANPPLNASKFIDVEQDQIHRRFTLRNQATVHQVSKVIKSRLRIAGKVDLLESSGKKSLMSLDAGYTNNAFSITIITAEETAGLDGKVTELRVPVVLEIVPRDGGSIHYGRVFDNVIVPLIKHFNVCYLFADRWNSIALLDGASDRFPNLETKIYSVKYDDFIITKSYLEEGKILLPKLEVELNAVTKFENYPKDFIGKPAAHLYYQMMTVRDRGKTVDKGLNATDDLFRALVLGVSRALSDKILPELLKPSIQTQGKRVMSVLLGRSMGASFTVKTDDPNRRVNVIVSSRS